MHITEGVLTGPSFVITNVIGAALIAKGVMAMQKFSKDQPQRKPLLGMLGAVVFFVSLIHLPAFGGLTCSHPCGTPFAGILLGPWVALGLAACSLLLQALFFAHGGISTLGANTITLGLAGAGSGWLTFKLMRKAGFSLGISAGLAGFVGDILTYAMNIVILGAHFAYVAPHPQYGFWGYAQVLALAYLPVQGPLAIGEMLLTGYAIKSIGEQRPEVLESLGVTTRKLAMASLLFVALGLAALTGTLRAAEAVVAPVAVAQPAAAPASSTAPAQTFGALDDMTDGLAERAGTPSKPPLLMDLEKYHDLWSSLMMFAGLAVGFIVGRRWHLLFGEPLKASAPAAEKR
jgi:cobalt/nickel transport system permease protein